MLRDTHYKNGYRIYDTEVKYQPIADKKEVGFNTSLITIFCGVIVSLISGGLIAVINLNTKVATLETRVGIIDLNLNNHLANSVSATDYKEKNVAIQHELDKLSNDVNYLYDNTRLNGHSSQVGFTR